MFETVNVTVTSWPEKSGPGASVIDEIVRSGSR